MGHLMSRERRALREVKRLDALTRERGNAVKGQPRIKGGLDRWPSAGASKPGASLHPAGVPYKIERPAKLGFKRTNTRPKRFATV